MPKGSWREFDEPSISRPTRPQSSSDKSELNVLVQKTRGGKGGKTVTVISGLNIDAEKAKHLLKRLKTICGTGGTCKGQVLEIQGDQVFRVLELLRKEGYRPKRSGG